MSISSEEAAKKIYAIDSLALPPLEFDLDSHELNEQLSVFRYLFQEGAGSMPLWVVFQSTTACNLSCPHCETHGTPELNQQFNSKLYVMPRDLLRAAAAETLPFAPEFALALNGEPMATPNLSEFLQFVRPFGSKLDLTTNAMLLRPDRLVQLMPVLGKVHVSLDGATPYVIERIRRGAKYSQLMRNIALLVRLAERHGFTVDLSFTVMASNIRELPHVVELASRLGIHNVFGAHLEVKFDQVRNEPLSLHKGLYNAYRELALREAAKYHVGLFLPPPYPNVAANRTPPSWGPGYIIDGFPLDYEPIQLSSLDFSGVDEEAKAISERVEMTSVTKLPPNSEQLYIMQLELQALAARHAEQLRKWWAENPQIPYCHYLHRACYLDSGGDVYPCCVTGRPTVGSIATSSVRDVWNGRLMDDFRRRFHSSDPYPCCVDCHFRTTIPARELFTNMGIEHLANPAASRHPIRLEEVRIEPGGMIGYLDTLRYLDGSLFAEGWSYDPLSGQPALTIALLSGDRVLYARGPNVERPDVVAFAGRESVRWCGFRFRVEGAGDSALRVLGISTNNVASELMRSEGNTG